MHRPYERRGVSTGTSVRDPESQERAREFLTFYFDFFIYFFVVFSTKIHNFERSFSLSESSSVPPCRFLLEVMVQSVVS